YHAGSLQWLAVGLRTSRRVFVRIVPGSTTESVEAAIEIMLEAVARREVGKAVVALEDVVGANPFWLRGYLLLATIYQHFQNADQAIATTEKGLAACASDLRQCGALKWVEAVGPINGPAVHNRIQNH